MGECDLGGPHPPRPEPSQDFYLASRDLLQHEQGPLADTVSQARRYSPWPNRPCNSSISLHGCARRVVMTQPLMSCNDTCRNLIAHTRYRGVFGGRFKITPMGINELAVFWLLKA